ncbi:hypothetical protein I7I51_02099 [Histoplasma capsulatum]|uniref:Uncharacterized protein n=1 Tax=Ajellomyces capsulatus TaxID=5037 RepID=A0A8A1MGC6_AJECA|nr:hypothetical protein I7I51_02099 [Histoplasma capsulatum]
MFFTSRITSRLHIGLKLREAAHSLWTQVSTSLKKLSSRSFCSTTPPIAHHFGLQPSMFSPSSHGFMSLMYERRSLQRSEYAPRKPWAVSTDLPPPTSTDLHRPPPFLHHPSPPTNPLHLAWRACRRQAVAAVSSLGISLDP